MAIVVNRSVSDDNQGRLVTGDKIDWTTMGFDYIVTPQTSFTSAATAFDTTHISGWDYTFSAVKGGIYEVTAVTNYLFVSANSELDFSMRVASGGRALATWDDMQTENRLARARQAELIIEATGTSVSIRCFVTVGLPSLAVDIYAGFIKSKRVA